jgi:uncharacterized protein (DUF1499 family)
MRDTCQVRLARHSHHQFRTIKRHVLVQCVTRLLTSMPRNKIIEEKNNCIYIYGEVKQFKMQSSIYICACVGKFDELGVFSNRDF